MRHVTRQSTRYDGTRNTLPALGPMYGPHKDLPTRHSAGKLCHKQNLHLSLPKGRPAQHDDTNKIHGPESATGPSSRSETTDTA